MCTRVLTAAMAAALVLATAHPPASAATTDPVGVWPLVPRPEVVAGFEPPAEEWGPGHRGVDLAGRSGQQVRAALPGTVAYAAVLAGRGVVVVDHGATRTTYEPVTATVERGERVAAGAALGHLELTSSHCFPAACLHWGWIADQQYLDPLRLVGGGPVRLWPLAGRPAPVGPESPTRVTVACAVVGSLARAWSTTWWATQARGCAWA